MGTPRLFGLDPSLNSTGVALPDGRVARVRPPGLRGMQRLAYQRSQVLQLLVACRNECGLDLVVLEGYSYRSKGNAVFDLAELGGVLRLLLYDQRVPYVEVPPQTLKGFACSNGNADKQQMVVAAQLQLGYEGNSSDEADALWLREVGLWVYGGGTSRTPRPKDAETLQGLAWPLLA